MSLPTDLQDALIHLGKVMQEHRVKSVSTRLIFWANDDEQGDHVAVPELDIEMHNLDDDGEAPHWGNVGSHQTKPSGVAERLQGSITRTIKKSQSRQANHRESIKANQALIADEQKRSKALRALIPSPLVELAKCAPTEAEMAE